MKGGNVDWNRFFSNPLFIVVAAIIVLILILAIFRSSSQYFGVGIGVNAHIGDLKGSFKLEAFDNQNTGSHATFVMFYANWCGHCQRTKPEFQKLKDSYKGSVKILMIDAELDEHKELVQSQNIKGFPTIRYYPSGLDSSYSEYDGERQSESFLSYLQTQSG
jgi:thiol-disulfide isomerase/thioredoxin